MKHWKKIVACSLVVALLLVVGGCAKSSQQQPAPEKPKATINLRLGHVVQTSHPIHIAADKFAKLVEERSNGRIKVTVYPARQLGDDRQMFEQLQQGSLDLGAISVAPIGSFTPIVTAFQLPWLINDYDVWLKAMTSDAAKKVFEGLKEVNIIGLAPLEGNMRHIVTTSKLVKVPQDLKGLKMRVAESPLCIDIWRSLGASPTPMPYGEIYAGLQNKVIDGLEMGLPAMWTEKHYEVAKYVTLSGHYPWPMPLLMSAKTWNSLSKEDQELIQKAAWDVIPYEIDVLKQQDTEALKQLEAKGVKFGEIPDMKPFLEATKPVYEKYTKLHPLIAEFVRSVEDLKARSK